METTKPAKRTAARKSTGKSSTATKQRPAKARKTPLPKESLNATADESQAAVAKVLAQSVCAAESLHAQVVRPVAVVVGASSGIGYHTALRLCRKGYAVYNIARSVAEPQKINNIHADVCAPHELSNAIESVFAREGHIDALIYSAGCSLACPLEHVTDDDIRNVFEVNYFGLLKALKTVIPIMRGIGGGRVIAVSSLASTMPIPFDVPYSASKAAVDMTLRALAIELYPYNIKLTSVQPSGVHTRFTYKRKVYPEQAVGSYTEAMQKAVAKLDLAEQNGMEPREVASFIVGLLDDKNPPLTTPVGLKDQAARAITKLLPTALTDYLSRMAWS